MQGGQSKLFNDEPISPGEHLRTMLEAKGWTQNDLAAITGRSKTQINDIVTGRRGITADMSVALSAALGTTAEFWMQLDARHRLASVTEDTNAVQRRAKLFDFAPVKEMQKRGWIRTTKTLEEIDAELRRFFRIESFDSPPEFPVALRKSAPLDDLTPAQRAWCFRALELAHTPPAHPFTRGKLKMAKEALRRLAAYPSETSRVAEVLSDAGVRFSIIEPIGGAKIDGCAFWIDAESPAIALSMRFDRIDYFWFTLMHELAHIENADALSVDTDLAGNERPPSLMKDEIERRADESAADSLVPSVEIDSFIRRVGPLYSKARINQFAHRIKIHPGIIVGQLQHRGEIGFGSNREMLAKVRSHVIGTALTDGWNQAILRDEESES